MGGLSALVKFHIVGLPGELVTRRLMRWLSLCLNCRRLANEDQPMPRTGCEQDGEVWRPRGDRLTCHHALACLREEPLHVGARSEDEQRPPRAVSYDAVGMGISTRNKDGVSRFRPDGERFSVIEAGELELPLQDGEAFGRRMGV
jgi:hypothetical protein